MTMSK